MTNADWIAREECEDPLGPAAWLMPLIVLFQSLVLMFGAVRDRLSTMRRTRRLPRNWRIHYERLRQAEWPIAFLLAEGARQLLSGRPLDLRALPDPGDAPDWFRPALPRTALAMHLRIDAAARFNAEPERYVQRHAERIARRTPASFDGGELRSLFTVKAALAVLAGAFIVTRAEGPPVEPSGRAHRPRLLFPP